MKSVILLTALTLAAIVGCREETQDKTRESSAADRVASLSDRPDSSVSPGDAQIVNSFGMEFVRISVDPSVNVQSDPPFPTETYYMQRTEVSDEHLRLFRAFAKSRNVDPQVYDSIPATYPSEWRDFSDLAKLMSKYDPDYDYRLPTKSEWVFACMSGYEQSCATNKPNAYGLVDMLDGYPECVSEVGVLMGLWIENWPGIYDGHTMPSCPCKRWTICNPDADDGLNEIIEGRFVLVRKNDVPPETPSKRITTP